MLLKYILIVQFFLSLSVSRLSLSVVLMNKGSWIELERYLSSSYALIQSIKFTSYFVFLTASLSREKFAASSLLHRHSLGLSHKLPPLTSGETQDYLCSLITVYFSTT